MQFEIFVEAFALKVPFVISRGARTHAHVVRVKIGDGTHSGQGECVPYPRYGESVESVTAALQAIRPLIASGIGRAGLQSKMPAGAARNAIDCALWDYDCKRLGISARELAGLHRIAPCVTAFTLSLGEPAAMGEAAAQACQRPVLKIKLGGGEADVARIEAVRAHAPDAVLLIDANEAWQEADLARNFAACEAAGVALIEQPLPAGQDSALARIARPIPVCADESVHDRNGLAKLRDRYDCINIKLDKTGGLTEALALAQAAADLDFGLFIGCMVGTSLGMAPAMLLTPQARFVDLDGPLLLADDRDPGLHYEGSIIHPPQAALWG